MFEAYEVQSGRSGTQRIVLTVFLVFAGGAGLGYVWKEGLFPVELLPVASGVVDPQVDADEQDPLAPLGDGRPIAAVPADIPGALPQDAAGMPQLPSQAEPFPPEAFPRELPSGQPLAPGRSVPPAQTTELPREAFLNPQAGLPTRFRRQRDDERTAATPAMPPSNIQQASFVDVTATTASTSSTVSNTTASTTAASTTAASTSVPVSDAGLPSAGPRQAEPASSGSALDLPALLEDYDAKVTAGEVLAAHRLLSQTYWKSPEVRSQIQERLDQSAKMIFFLPQPHFVEPYLIEPGDRLESIAAEYQVPWEYLSKVNRVDPKRIQAGRRLKVIRGPFAAVVELADFSLTVHLQGYYVRRFPVGIGRDNASPIGKYAVLNKVVNPQYTDPDGRVIQGDDPANPLGERWIDLGNSYGIHGTTEPDSIGKAASRGCIRLNDADVIAVYDFLSVGSEVVIRR